MGRYSVKRKQDLSGIATLTGNPIAIDNISAEIKKIKQKAVCIAAVPKSAFTKK